MVLSIASAAVIAALFLSLSVEADRTLRESGPYLKGYRFGYFVAGLCCLLALAALYQCTVAIRELVHPGPSPLVLAGAVAAARGIVRRRRLGWILFPVPCLLTPWFMATLTGTQIAEHAAWAGASCLLPAAAGYALRRWCEFDDVVERSHPPPSLRPDGRVAS